MKFKCVKCNGKEANVRKVFVYTSFKSHPYKVISCKKCGYSELYENKEESILTKIKNKLK